MLEGYIITDLDVQQHVISVVHTIGNAHKELEQIENGAARERISITAAFVVQVWIAFEVEHLVGGKIHASVENLEYKSKYSSAIDLRHLNNIHLPKCMSISSRDNRTIPPPPIRADTSM